MVSARHVVSEAKATYNRPMKPRSIVSLVGLSLLAAVTLLVAACGGGGSSTPAVTIPAGALVVEAGPGLVLGQSAYTTAAVAGKVVIAYVQKDSARHTLLVRDAAGIIIGQKLEVIKSGSVALGTYDLPPGVYEILCDVPGHGSMKATLTVT